MVEHLGRVVAIVSQTELTPAATPASASDPPTGPPSLPEPTDPSASQWDPRRPFTSKPFWLLLAVVAIVLLGGVLLLVAGVGTSEPQIRAVRLVIGFSIGLALIVLLVSYLMNALFEPQTRAHVVHPLPNELLRQCSAMAQYAMERGRTPEGRDIQALSRLAYFRFLDRVADCSVEDLKELGAAHRRLSALVAPAMPKTLVLLSYGQEDEKTERKYLNQGFAWLGTVRLVRMMLGLAILLVPLFVALALATGDNFQATIVAVAEELDPAGAGELGSGGGTENGLIMKLLTGAYLIVAAALGASFAALFKARRYIENLSYDDQYEASYWMRFVLGLVAGLILSVLLAVVLFPEESTSSDSGAARLTIPLLALVGGFSSDLVYRVLKRIIDAVETLVQGSASELADAQRQAAESRLQIQNAEANSRLQKAVLAAKSREADQLISILDEIPLGAEFQPVRQSISARLTKLLQSDAGTPGSTPPLPEGQ